jgi:N-acetylmuramoyl-L-alanine amidase
LAEDSLTLAVAKEAERQLRALGAVPFLTRPGPEPISLEARIALAEARDAQCFVSIHVNAPGDGRPPWSVDGTRIYWLNALAFPLAKALADSVAMAMHQPSRETIQSDLAVLRPTWFPAALVEATSLVLPVREAYLRSPAGITEYASGVVAGIRRWIAPAK